MKYQILNLKINFIDELLETELINNLDEIINLDQLYNNKMINKLKTELENLNNLTTQCLYLNLIKNLFDNNELACNNYKTLIQKYSFLIESRGLFIFFSFFKLSALK